MDISNGVVYATRRNTAQDTVISWGVLHAWTGFNSEIDNVSSNQLTSTAFNTILTNAQDASKGTCHIKANVFRLHQTASHSMPMGTAVSAIQHIL